MSSEEYPLVLSMTEFSMFRRCRKKFELAAIRGLQPNSTNDAVKKGSEFHHIMEQVARSGGDRPTESIDPMFHEMLPIAQEYYDHIIAKGENPWLPERVVSVERGYFAEVAPNVFIRCSFDLVWLDDGELIVQDYKTFSKAPSLDSDELDPQANEYLVVASEVFKTDRLQFRWEYVRSELGRMLSGGRGKDAVYTPWTAEERYIRQELVQPAHVIEQIRKELHDCALDIREAIERERFYRSGLKGAAYAACEACFYRHLCKAELAHGSLSDEDIMSLATFEDPAERVEVETMLDDPRVKWYEHRDIQVAQAIANVYGNTGRTKYEESLKR